MSQGLDSDRVAYWAEIVRQYRKSGLSQPEFCQRRGLTLGSLKNWLSKVPYRQAVDRFLEQRQGGPSGPTTPNTPEASGLARGAAVIRLPATVRVFVAVGPTDLRRGFDGLAQQVRDVLEADPLSGHLFVFANRRRDRVKVLYWDRDGFALWMKRLEKGTFRWPAAGTRRLELSPGELAALLGGIDLAATRRRPRYRRTGS
jgi:transposase